VPGFEATQWYGVIAPAGTPEPIIARLNQEIRNALKEPRHSRSAGEGRRRAMADVAGRIPRAHRQGNPRWKVVVDRAKIKVE